MNFGSEKMTGKEKFELDGKSLGFDFKDFWEFQYSNIYNMQETIAEFLVAKALGLDESYNTGYWTLFDVFYRDTRIEVKQTSYYHPWNEGGKVSQVRTFGITKANSNYEGDGGENIGAVAMLENKQYELAFNNVQNAIEKLENDYGVKFVLTCSASKEDLPAFVLKYVD